MRSFSGLWRRLRSQLRPGPARGRHPLRQARDRFFSHIAAQVEPLESRALLSITYHGGALLANVEAQNVFLGSDWQTNNNLKPQETRLNNFTATMVQSTFMDGLTLAGYNVYRGTSSPGVVDNLTLDKNVDGGITDAQIQADLQALINTGKVQAPDANRLYMVFVEPSVVISMADGSNSIFFFAGYHGAFTGQTAGGAAINIHYAVMAYPNFPNDGITGTTSLPGAATTNFLTVVAGHELAEAVTDPDGAFADSTGDLSFAGWFDDSTGEEVADVEEGTAMMYKTFEIQSIATKDEQPISFNSITQKLTAPTGLTLTASITSPTDPTKGVLSWGASPLAEGYRVFQIKNGVKTLLGTTDAFTTSFDLTGLSAGIKVSFMVEAFNSTLKADSAVISGTPPFATASASPISTAKKLPPPTAPTIDHGAVAVMPGVFFDGPELDSLRRRLLH